MEGGIIGIALFGALITYAGTGLWEIGLCALMLNFVIMGGAYAFETDKDQ